MEAIEIKLKLCVHSTEDTADDHLYFSREWSQLLRFALLFGNYLAKLRHDKQLFVSFYFINWDIPSV